MKFTPRIYQTEAIKHLKNHRQAALFAGCGLGKTASVLQAVTELINEGKIKAALIVAPLRVANLTWSNEIDKWAFNLTFANLRTKEGIEAWKNGTAQIYTINFEALPKLCREYLAGVDLSDIVLVIDELARIGQNDITQIFRLICSGTIDDAIAEAIRDKGDRQSSFLNALVNNLKRMI